MVRYTLYMPETWLNFSVIIFVQFLLFIICAFYEKRLSDVARILGLGILTGIVFGLLFDLVFGKFSGFHEYVLGFGVFFLILNAALSYSLFAANILLMQRLRLLQFYIWTVVIVAVYEITNYFFPVWTWEFTLSPIELLMVLSAGYFGGAILIATVWHMFLGHRFLFIDNLLKK